MEPVRIDPKTVADPAITAELFTAAMAQYRSDPNGPSYFYAFNDNCFEVWDKAAVELYNKMVQDGLGPAEATSAINCNLLAIGMYVQRQLDRRKLM